MSYILKYTHIHEIPKTYMCHRIMNSISPSRSTFVCTQGHHPKKGRTSATSNRRRTALINGNLVEKLPSYAVLLTPPHLTTSLTSHIIRITHISYHITHHSHHSHLTSLKSHITQVTHLTSHITHISHRTSLTSSTSYIIPNHTVTFRGRRTSW